MNNKTLDICSIVSWYKELSEHTFPTSFVKLNDVELKALIAGEVEGKVAEEVAERLKHPMASFPGNCFLFTDITAPTDTERFELKRGAVYSPQSGWKYLAMSEKIRNAASVGNVNYICIRPFRRMSKPREFRLFIKDGKLKGMSQYWLIRHYRRLEGRKKEYWDLANKFVEQIAWLLPCKDIVMDVYFTSDHQILIIDFNPWGGETSPLIFRSWDRDWDAVSGIELIKPPTQLGGDVNVSF